MFVFLSLLCYNILHEERSYIMKFVSLVVLSLFSCSAFAATHSRPAMSNKIMSGTRYTASINQLNGMAVANGVANTDKETATTVEEKKEVDKREAERNACINNNIGIGNTFVWASRLSDSSNYTTMVEDTEHPENNVCFVRVELKSDNASRVDVSDVKSKYFTWGETIKCGSWVNEDEMEKRILAAKKGARVGGIVAGAVGGTALGVGAMELFGNKLIGGKVQGQKSLEDEKLWRSVLLTYKDKEPAEYKKIVGALKTMKEACDDNPNMASCGKYRELIAEFAE